MLQVCPKDYMPSLLKWVDPENLPRYLGGTSDATLIDDAGPWNDPQIRAEIEEDIAYRDGTAGKPALKPEALFGYCKRTVCFEPSLSTVADDDHRTG